MNIPLEQELSRFFGYDEFRLCQKEIVQAILQKKDVLAILPTGAGKSICYQLPAMLMPGIAVVVSPLISLMQDQVVGLAKKGISAVFLNSSLRYWEIQAVMDNLSSYKLLYVAPERFADLNFLACLQKIPVSLFAIDEAHCISQWGHSFRPDYRQLSLVKERFPMSPIVALTATATKDVENDILGQLAMRNPYVARASFDRPNLTFHVHAKAGNCQLQEFLAKHKGKPGIIYAATRKTVDETYEELRGSGVHVGKYHAGLPDAERAKAQDDFIHGDVSLIVATVAFGMGIHKPDIRFIVHLDMPRSLEQYYQEVGRAGRDGLPAECLMLYSGKEFIVYEFFLQQMTNDAERSAAKEKTRKIYAFCQSQGCRRKELLQYFGEMYSQSNCQGCNHCLGGSELSDETEAAQKILSCVYRLHQRFGASYVVEVLRGANTKAVQDRRHQSLSTYGIMRDYSVDDIRYYIDVLMSQGFLQKLGDEYPLLSWTATSPQLLNGSAKFMVRKLTPVKKIPVSNDSSRESACLFQQGLSVEAIAQMRGLSVGSILTHLSKQILAGEPLDITPVVSPERQDKIRQVITTVGMEKLTPIKQALPEDFTFDEIKLVCAVQQRGATNNAMDAAER